MSVLFAVSQGRPRRGFVWFSRLLMAEIFVAGLVFWMLFFNFGVVNHNYADWLETYRVTIVADAVRTNQLPFFMSEVSAQGTDRYLGVADTQFTPTMLTLPFLSIGQFVLFETLLFYTLGFVACWLIKRRYQLSLIVFIILWLLFNFNGHLVAHLHIGNIMWPCYFLLAWFALFVLELVETSQPGKSALKLAFLLFFIVMEGGFHFFIWCAWFLLALGVANRRLFFLCLGAIVGGGLLSAFRFLPPVLTYEGRAFGTGYPSLLALLQSLIQMEAPIEVGVYKRWEFTLYIGVIGLAFMLWFGVVERVREVLGRIRAKYALPMQRPYFGAFDVPMLLIFVFALGNTYRVIFDLPLPAVQSERVSSRMIILPFVMLLIFACIRFQRSLPKLARTLTRKLLLIGTVIVGGVMLLLNAMIWRVPLPLPGFVPANVHLVPLHEYRLTAEDETYVMLFWIGLAVSAMSLVVWFWLYMRSVRKR